MKHFLDLASWDTQEVRHILDLAIHLKHEWQSGGNRPVMQNKILGMIFQKPSLRTRVSFEVAMKHLGGSAIMLGPQEIGLGKREAIPDVARVLSSYVDIIMARVFDHQHVTELAEWSRVPVINGLSDDYHPCQAMADMLTIHERFGHLEGIKVAYIGDGNNVAASLLYACAHFGCEFAIATPEGYELPQSVRDIAAPLVERSGITVTEAVHIDQVIQGADVLYTDTWISMGQEDEAAERRATFDGYQINDDLLARTGKPSIVLHCLPAHRGEEITDNVMDGAQSAVFQQAENRLHAQKAILVHLLAQK
ncbi:MAG: ornithine carbamoyltransferase [Phototrophicaceae bacterium]